MINTNPTLLAVETSCDDTSVAVLKDGKILSNIVSSQIEHGLLGGVVPEIASRAHVVNIQRVAQHALQRAGIPLTKLDGIACTIGPGLMGSLVVGLSFAKSLAQVLQIPLIGVNHMKAHILAHFIEEPKPQFPFLCLTVSGGHTQIVKVSHFLNMEVLGETQDDAAGEAFDKIGKMLGLPYPAGVHIDNLAKEGRNIFTFSKPRLDKLDFSFSGFKTSVLYFLQHKMKEDPKFIEMHKKDLAASVQASIVEILMDKLVKASKLYDIKEIAIAGGVSANASLRSALKLEGEKRGWKTYIPSLQYSTDNAAMIAISAHYQYLSGDFCNLSVQPNPRLKI
jgi:N6-L-threonylcarbamoyladenine synthase